MKPVLYLDVDGVLWDVAEDGTFKGSNGLESFMNFALENFEVRWLTSWALEGYIREDRLPQLENFTKLSLETWKQVCPSMKWRENKTEAIDWEEHFYGRPFVWIEDGLLDEELIFLSELNYLDCYIHTDVFEDPDALIKAHKILLERFQL